MKCGVIGCGVIAPTHIAGLKNLPDVELTTLCDLIPERVEKLAKEHLVPKTCLDYREMLADPEITAVNVCTDHASHARIVCDALNAGKHVICEKVPGRTPEDLKMMADTANAHPELVAAGIFQHRFVPANIALRELIRQEKFGKLLVVNLNFCCLRTNEYYNKDAWRGTVAGEGGGVLINQAIHFLDQLRFLFGEIKQVSAQCANLTHQGVIETEDTATFNIEFTSGLFATVGATNSAAAKWRSALTITATDAQVEFINEKLTFLLHNDEAKEAELRTILEQDHNAQSVVGKAYYGSGHNAQIADFIDAIKSKRAPQVTLADAANTAALVHAVYASAATGSWQKVADYLGK